MGKKIRHIISFLTVLLLVSCAKNEKYKSTKIEATETKDSNSKEDSLTYELVEEESFVSESKENTALKDNLTEKTIFIENKFMEGIELYQLLSDSKIENEFKNVIKTDINKTFDNSNWLQLNNDITQFKFISKKQDYMLFSFKSDDIFSSEFKRT